MKILIVDDERTALAGLRVLLSEFCENAEVVGEASSAIEALKLIRTNRPDLVLLDIEMPGGNGFEMLEALDEHQRPHFIFITAHAEHSIRAVRAGASDYLLKPVDVDELVAAIEHVRKKLNKQEEEPLASVSGHRVRISDNRGIQFVPVSEIICIRSDGRYSVISLISGAEHTVAKTLGDFEMELNAHQFFRVHRSYLINCRHVESISHTDGGFVEMKTGKSIEISRRKKAEFIRLMEKN